MTLPNSLKSALAAIALVAGGIFSPLTEGAQAQSQQIGPGNESVTLAVNEGRLVRLSSPSKLSFRGYFLASCLERPTPISVCRLA